MRRPGKSSRHSRLKKHGLPPGSLVFTGTRKVDEPLLTVYTYDEKNYEKTELKELDDQNPALATAKWIDLRGLHQIELIRKLGQTYQMHVLMMEGIADVHQRSKLEENDDSIFFICNNLTYNAEKGQIEKEQITCYLKSNVILSFQENEDNLFAPVSDRIEQSKGRIRKFGSDYLFYALIDLVVDNYYKVIDAFDVELDAIEEELNTTPESSTKARIHRLKSQIVRVRKYASPLRESISRLQRSEHPFLTEQTKIFLRDLYDHIIQVLENLDAQRENVSGLQDLYLSEISFRMNKVMQVLTIISTIFIPLTFLAGIYGMNFEYIPELGFKYGYFILLGVMAAVGIGLLFLFRKVKWL